MVSVEIYFSNVVGSDVIILQVPIHIFPIDVDILFLVVLAVGPWPGIISGNSLICVTWQGMGQILCCFSVS